MDFNLFCITCTFLLSSFLGKMFIVHFMLYQIAILKVISKPLIYTTL